jgi:hypothetical protein
VNTRRSTRKEVLVARASSITSIPRTSSAFSFFRRRFTALRLDSSLGNLLRLLRQPPRFALSFRLNTLLSSNSQHSLYFTTQLQKRCPLTIAATAPSSTAAEDVTSLFRRLHFLSSTFPSPSTSIASASPSTAAASGFSASQPLALPPPFPFLLVFSHVAIPPSHPTPLSRLPPSAHAAC